MDKRLTAANGRVAARVLHGKVKADRFVDGVARQLTVPVADLLHAPDGRRERQLLWGDQVRLFEVHDGWAFVQSDKDGFVGYLPSGVLGDVPQTGAHTATHWVTAPATHLYPESTMKSRDLALLSFGSKVDVVAETEGFFETPQGFIPKPHLMPADFQFDDPVEVATLFLGTPYLWGGNSRSGIDCSGLVQAGYLACGLECPGDSDLQEAHLGQSLSEDATLLRGDLLFWKGHVALVVDGARLLHANAHHMSVAYEGIDDAISRILIQGDGPVTTRKRIDTNLKVALGKKASI